MGAPAREPVRIVFVCVENSCRSQMAEGFARAMAPAGVEVYSAGSNPSGRVNPRAVECMLEAGIDIAGHASKSIFDLPPVRFDAAVTMGCGDACPSLAAARRINWAIPDPKTLPPEGFRAIREAIRREVEGLLRELAPVDPAGQTQIALRSHNCR